MAGDSCDSRLRLNQAIAKTGLCSRRKADNLIAEGRVSVNGEAVANFALLVDPACDTLCIDGQPVSFKKCQYVLLHKPPGFVTTMSDEAGRQTVMDLLPGHLSHLRPVGRLDMYSEGLLILTNDGRLTQKLTHPVHHLPKLYRVIVSGCLDDRDLRCLKTGIPLEDGQTLPAKVKLVSRNDSYSEVDLTLVEGRNRQIRRMFAYLGYRVLRLVRLSIGRLQLGQIAAGTWRYLTNAEISLLTSEQP